MQVGITAQQWSLGMFLVFSLEITMGEIEASERVLWDFQDSIVRGEKGGRIEPGDISTLLFKEHIAEDFWKECLDCFKGS